MKKKVSKVKKQWRLDDNGYGFVQIYPEPQMMGGGVYIVNSDRSMSFMATYMEDTKSAVMAQAQKIVDFLNK